MMENNLIPLITKELLKEWDACEDGYNRFNELFPEGATLLDAIQGLVLDRHDGWGKWLFDNCKERGLYPEIIKQGYRNSGDWNSGDWNSGNRNSGDWNSGDWNSGNRNSGYGNSGYCNSGDGNSGNRNSGDGNSGNRNSGDWNSGNRNSGDWNSGNRNSGDWNSGDWNSGNRNSGYGNSGYCNTGLFNTTNSTVFLFNKDSGLTIADYRIQKVIGILNNMKPVVVWIPKNEMTEKEKEKYPSYKTTGGYLKQREYKYTWQKNWEKFNEEQKQAFLDLPNFDAKIFEEITGINVEKK